MSKKYIAVIFLIIASAQFAYTQTIEDVFNRANEMYRVGKYKEAIAEYEKIIKQNIISAEIYFNLGNAYYRNEQLAQAILSYERAANLRPNDPDIQHNLKLVYLKTIDRIEPVPEMFLIQWMRAVAALLSPDTVKVIFIISWIFLFCSLSIMYLVLRTDVLRIMRILFFSAFVLVVLSAMMMGIQTFQETSKDKAIIIEQTVTAKSSPDAKSVDAFVIHEGLKVKLTDSVGEWRKITLADGKVGWILSSQCEKI